MRIAVISPFVDRRHGTERALAEVLDRLAAQHGDTIDLYAQKVSDLNCSFNSANSAGDSAKIIWHRVRTLPGPHLIQFLGWFFLNRWKRWRTEACIKSEVIFSPGINAADADVILVHVVFHRVAELQQSRRARGLVALHRKLYYALLCGLERRIYRDPRVTLAAVSRHTAAQLARYLGRHDVTVIPNGVDAQHFSPATVSILREQYRRQWDVSPHALVLLLMGNDWRNKGLQTLLLACSQCNDLPLRLLIVGQDEQQPFRAEAEKLGITARVQFFSPVPDVRIFYSAADILVAPSLEDSFNLPVLEAMSCGLPVIVSPAAGISDWLTNDKDSLVLKDPQDTAELANAIRSFAAHPSRRDAIIRCGLETAKTFSWNTHASELRKLLVQAAAEKSRRK